MKVPSKIRKRFLRSKEIRLMRIEMSHQLGLEMHFNRLEEWTIDKEIKLFLMDESPLVIQFREVFLPTFNYQESLESLPNVEVDMGAIPYICGGADVMAPGITEIKGNFEHNSLIVVRDERHKKALAIGSTLYSSKEMRQKNKGKVVKNLHYVGDKIWKIYK
jgi:PUA domain protein